MMKKSVIIVIVLFLSLNAFCQSKDSIKLKNLEYLFIMCSQERQLINYTGYQFNNQLDSLNSCL